MQRNGSMVITLQNWKKNGNYVDVTWDNVLELFGFKVLPEDWTPEKSFIGVQNIIQKWEGVQIDDKKKELIEGLEIAIKERRKRFLSLFIRWIDSIHK